MSKSTIQFPTQQTDAGKSLSPNVAAALLFIREKLDEGLEHGFFQLEIKGTIGNGNRREVTVISGTSHRFNIAADELDR